MRGLSKTVAKMWREFKKGTKGQVTRGDPPDSRVPKRNPRRAGDSISSVRKRKSGPNKGMFHPMREYFGPDGKVHSAPAVRLPKSQQKRSKGKSKKGAKTRKS